MLEGLNMRAFLRMFCNMAMFMICVVTVNVAVAAGTVPVRSRGEDVLGVGVVCFLG